MTRPTNSLYRSAAQQIALQRHQDAVRGAIALGNSPAIDLVGLEFCQLAPTGTGANGDATTLPTWTYDVFLLSDLLRESPVLEGAVPRFRFTTSGFYEQAAAGDRCICYRDENGDYELVMTLEPLDTTSCDPAGP